jgi:organic radical activating enzyme
MGSIIVKIQEFSSLIDWIWVLGGEPLLQDRNDLRTMLKILKSMTLKPIMLWTSFEYEEIPENILKLCDYVKTGMYLPEYGEGTEQYGIKLATANQKIFKLNVN